MAAYKYVYFKKNLINYRGKWIQRLTLPEMMGLNGMLPLYYKTRRDRDVFYIPFDYLV
jgi:hypothetical protein